MLQYMQKQRTWVIFFGSNWGIFKMILLLVTIDDLILNESASINYLY